MAWIRESVGEVIYLHWVYICFICNQSDSSEKGVRGTSLSYLLLVPFEFYVQKLPSYSNALLADFFMVRFTLW